MGRGEGYSGTVGYIALLLHVDLCVCVCVCVWSDSHEDTNGSLSAALLSQIIGLHSQLLTRSSTLLREVSSCKTVWAWLTMGANLMARQSSRRPVIASLLRNTLRAGYKEDGRGGKRRGEKRYKMSGCSVA